MKYNGTLTPTRYNKIALEHVQDFHPNVANNLNNLEIYHKAVYFEKQLHVVGFRKKRHVFKRQLKCGSTYNLLMFRSLAITTSRKDFNRQSTHPRKPYGSKILRIMAENNERKFKFLLGFCHFFFCLHSAISFSALIERYFSRFELVWSKLHNRLGSDKATKLKCIVIYKQICWNLATCDLGVAPGRGRRPIPMDIVDEVAVADHAACALHSATSAPLISILFMNSHYTLYVTAWCGFTCTFIVGPYFFERITPQGCVWCTVTSVNYQEIFEQL
ncbi:hypothetical protein PR048_021656 [Dryococelus australis]|uniref:Uncharacterized protein n=1 Tax=Dryococelus australis TaxID=614101 RepID=A0ABQ9GYU6_9NEOP|nr:hypothetical protein PR048_021656 [Dryococelus australis]